MIVQVAFRRSHEVLGETETGSGVAERFIKSMRFVAFESRR